MKTQKGISTFFAILIVGLIALIGFTVLYSYQYIWVLNGEVITPEKEKPMEGVFDSENWETFIDKKAGYKLSYPDYVKLVSQDLTQRKTIKNLLIPEVIAAGVPGDFKEGLVLFISKEKIKNMKNDSESFLWEGRESALRKKEEIEKGNPVELEPFDMAEEIIKLNGRNVATSITLSQYEVCDLQFTRSLLFFNNGFEVKITLQSIGKIDEITSEMPEFFTTHPTSCGNYKTWNFENNAGGKFYDKLSKGEGKGEAQLWYDAFYKIISTFKFID